MANNPNKKKKDPLASAARQVVKETASSAVKKTQPKKTAQQKVQSVAKKATGNVVRQKAPGTTRKTQPKKQSKPFKASNISGNTGRGVGVRDRQKQAQKVASIKQAKARPKKKMEAIKKGQAAVFDKSYKNAPNRLSQMDEMMLSEKGKNQVNYAKHQWAQADKRGDEAGKKLAHATAELARMSNPTEVKTFTPNTPTKSQVTAVALQRYAQAMQAGDEEGMRQARNLAAEAMLRLPSQNKEQTYMTGAYSGGSWGDRAVEASETDLNMDFRKNLGASELSAAKSELYRAGAGYIDTVMNAPARLTEGSSQLVVKDPHVDKTKPVDQFSLRGQSRYTEEDALGKSREWKAQSEWLKEQAYRTTPIPGVGGRFVVDATGALTGMGLDMAANAVIPGSGLVNMGARTWGSEVQKAKDYMAVNGTAADPNADAKAYLYGSLMTAAEVGSEKMFNSSKLFKAAYGRGLADTLMRRTGREALSNPTIARQLLRSGLEEGSEELAADLVQWQMPRIYGEQPESFGEMAKGAAYDFAVGAALGGLGGAVSAPAEVRQQKVNNLRQRMLDAGVSDAAIDQTLSEMSYREAETMLDASDSTFAEWVQDRVAGGGTGRDALMKATREKLGTDGTEEPVQLKLKEKQNLLDSVGKRLTQLGVDKSSITPVTTGFAKQKYDNELVRVAEMDDNEFSNWASTQGLISPENSNQSLSEASAEQSSEQTFEGAQTTVSRGKAWYALRSRLRESGIRDSQMLKTIRDRMTPEEMEEAANLRKNDFLEWRDRITSPDYRPPAREQEETPAPAPAPQEPAPQAAPEAGAVTIEPETQPGEKAPTVNELTPEALRKQSEMLEKMRNNTLVQDMAETSGKPVSEMNEIDIMGALLGKNGQQTLVNNFNAKLHTPAWYVQEMFRAYNAGFAGVRYESFNYTINKKLASLMYQAGRGDAQLSMREQKAEAKNRTAYKRADAGLQNQSDPWIQKNVKGITRNQLDRLGKALGVQIYFADAVGGLNARTKESIANGSYADGIVLIAKDSDMPANFVIGHELTHRMKDVSPEAYEGLLKYYMSLQRAEEDIAEITALYARAGIPRTQEELTEEAVADFVGKMIHDQDMLQRFADRADRSIVQKFLDALKAIARKLSSRDLTDVEQAIRTIETALDKSVQANRKLTRRNPAVVDTKVLESRAVVDSDTGEVFSLKSLDYDLNEGKMFEDLIDAGIMNKEQTDALRSNINDLVKKMMNVANIVDLNEEYTKEDRPYSPLKPNSDPLYKISLDFTTMCRKRLLTQSIIERIQVAEGKAMTPDRQLKVRELLQEYRKLDRAVQVACGMCYVEAARYKSPKPINAWLKNPTTVVTKYFAKKDKVFNKRLQELAGKKKEEFGYPADTPKKNLTNEQKNILNKFLDDERKKYKLTDQQKKILAKIKAMPPETFLTEKNLTKLLMEEPVIYDIFISNVRAATRSKAVQGSVPYYYGDSNENLKDSAIQNMNAENGLRFSSWSDWQVQHMLDMMVAIIDMSVRGVKMHGYTKFPEFVRIFGNTGMQFNLSGVLGTVEPIINEDGTYSQDNFDSVEGVDIKEAIETRDKFPETAGIQCIGVSDEQIKALLQTDWIDYIIPYHSSGLNKALRKIAKIEEWKDYTKVQEAHPVDKNAEPGEGDDVENWHKEPVFSEFMVWEGENGLDCMRKSARKYVEMCEKRGMVPKFNDIRLWSEQQEEDNYWKLLIDRKMINQESKELIIQQAVKPDFDFNEMKNAIDREVKEYNPRRETEAFKYVVENANKGGLRFSKDVKEQAAKITSTFVENVVSEPKEQKLSLKSERREFNDTVVLEESTVDTYLRDYAAPSSPNYAQAYIVHMSPRQFLDLTTSITGRAAIEREATDLDLDQLANATRFQPFQLRINHETGEVYGHEGRHRMEALRRNNVYAVPVLLFDSSNKSSKEFMDSLTLTGQDFGSTRSLAMATVHDLLPLSYANRDEIIKRFATQPTNERIAENYGKETVRYSLKRRDDDYMKAVRDGDMEKAQRMVDEAAKEAGFPVEVYHGTKRFGFTEPDTGKSDDRISFFVTEDPETASTYSGTVYSRVIDQSFVDYEINESDDYGPKNNYGMYRLYMRPGKLLEVDAKGARWNRIQWDDSYMSTREIARAAKDAGYDGVHFINVVDSGGMMDVEADAADVYALFYPERDLKSADPITIANDGSVIPLSKRFDPNIPDIRWSIKGGRAYEELLAEYGAIEPGERPSRNIQVPRQTSDEEKVSQTIRTVMEARRTPEELLPTLEQMIESGEFSYESFGDKAAVNRAQRKILSGGKNGLDDAYAEWYNQVQSGIVSKELTAMGWVLYSSYVKEKNYDRACKVLIQIDKHQRNAAQALQATRILKTFPPEIRLAVDRARGKVDPDNEDLIDEDEYWNDEEFWGDRGVDTGDTEEGENEGRKKASAKPRKPRQRLTQDDVDKIEEDNAEYRAEHSKATFLDKWNAWRYMAMLANLRTHIRNVVGNAGFFPVVMSKNVVATAAEIAIYHTVGKRGGMERTKGIYNPKAFAFAWSDYKTMRATILGELKYEGQDLEMEVVFPGLFGKPFEAVRRLNSNLLNLEDSWFSKPHYANALAQYMAANGITAEMMETGVGIIERGANKGKPFTQEMANKARAYAVKEAQKGTYRDLNAFSEMFMRLGTPRSENPGKAEKVKDLLINGVLPFKKTPANILCRAVEYSPIGFTLGLKKLLYDVPYTHKIAELRAQGATKKNGEEYKDVEVVTVAEALDALAAGLSGTALFSLGMMLAEMGILIAKTDDGDDEQKWFNRLLGHQQWAVEIDDTSYTIDWLAPEVIPMFMGAQLFREMEAGSNGVRTVTRMLEAMSGVADPILELSCMSGIQQVLDDAASFAEGDLNTMVALIGSMGLSYFTQAIPTLAGQLERVSQAERMQTFTSDSPDELFSKDMQYLIGKVSAKVPGWDYRQIPYVDAWGNTETETSVFKRIVANMFSPAYVKKIDTRAVNKELQRLYDATGDGSVLPDPGWKTYNYKDENGVNHTVYLSAEEYVAYSRAKGRTQFDLVDKFIKSKSYKGMTDADRAGVLKDIYDYSEYKAQSEYIHDFKGEPKSWIGKYEEFSNRFGGYDVFDYIVVRGATKDVKGLYDPNKPGENAVKNTKSAAVALAIYHSGAKIPTDPDLRNEFLDTLEVNSKEVRGWNQAQTEQFMENMRKKGYK